MTTPIYHITHVDNLPSIIDVGLLCDQEIAHGTPHHSIAHTEIKRIRAETVVPCAPGGTLDQYIPFYFAPRSPMLYTINQGNVPSVHDGQANIVHLVFDAEQLAETHDYAFTNGHAIMGLSDFFNDLADLDQLDWDSINTHRWGTYYDRTDETKRKKQSEFLARGVVTWEHVQSIGVPSHACGSLAVAAVDGQDHSPPIRVQTDWYY